MGEQFPPLNSEASSRITNFLRPGALTVSVIHLPPCQPAWWLPAFSSQGTHSQLAAASRRSLGFPAAPSRLRRLCCEQGDSSRCEQLPASNNRTSAYVTLSNSGLNFLIFEMGLRLPVSQSSGTRCL